MQLCSELPRHLRAQGLPSQRYIQMAQRSCNSTRASSTTPPTPSATRRTQRSSADKTRDGEAHPLVYVVPAWPHNCKSGFAMREASGNAPVTCGAMRECLRREVLLSAATLPHSHTGELGPPQSRWTISPDTPMLRAKRVGSNVRWVKLMTATTMAQLQIPDWTASPANDCVQGPLGCKGI